MPKRVSPDDRAPAGAGVAGLFRSTSAAADSQPEAPPAPAYVRAAFSLSSQQLEALDLLHLELRRLGVQASKSELVGLALEDLLRIRPNSWAALITSRLSGSRRRR